MDQFTTPNEILDFAMENEQRAVDFYNQLARNARNDDMRGVFEQFAREEIGHKARLARIKEEGMLSLPTGAVADLRIADYTVRAEPGESITYEQALVLAMKREKAAFKLYLKLSQVAPSPELQQLFLALAQEESRHKLRFELEYDEFVLREN